MRPCDVGANRAECLGLQGRGGAVVQNCARDGGGRFENSVGIGGMDLRHRHRPTDGIGSAP